MINYNVKDYRKERWLGFKQYNLYENDSYNIQDCVKQYCDSKDLNFKEREWMSYLYGLTFCIPTNAVIFDKIPDPTKVTKEDLELFWKENKSKLLFQSDRKKVQNFDKFVDAVLSYKGLELDDKISSISDFNELKPTEQYWKLYHHFEKLYYYGNFGLNKFLGMLRITTNLNFEYPIINLKEAESSKNGMCYVCNLDDMVSLHHNKPVKEVDYKRLEERLLTLITDINQDDSSQKTTMFDLDANLCVYKKLFWEDRYLGYYIDRFQEELVTNKKLNPEFNFSFFWKYRKDNIPNYFLGEINGWNGIRPERNKIFMKYGRLLHPMEEQGGLFQ